MALFRNKRSKKICLSIGIPLLVVALLFGACAIYVCDYYHADTETIATFAPMQSVERHVLDNGAVVFEPRGEAVAGLIFYPGGKVEHTAYEPLMAACAERGLLCILVEMPLRLAVLDVNAADGMQEMYPEIEDWYLGGHSLGGSMAASYLEKHADEYEGLILLGSYSTADLSQSGLSVLSVFGSEDTVMNREKYDKYWSNLPPDAVEYIIEGGCHAYFGMYGAQKGDGTPTISNDAQINITAQKITELLKGVE